MFVKGNGGWQKFCQVRQQFQFHVSNKETISIAHMKNSDSMATSLLAPPSASHSFLPSLNSYQPCSRFLPYVQWLEGSRAKRGGGGERGTYFFLRILLMIPSPIIPDHLLTLANHKSKASTTTIVLWQHTAATSSSVMSSYQKHLLENFSDAFKSFDFSIFPKETIQSFQEFFWVYWSGTHAWKFC